MRETDNQWKVSDSPSLIFVDKPSVMKQIAADPQAWFCGCAGDLTSLSLDEMLLVDDTPKNFESEATGVKLPRCCLVRRYKADFRGWGVMTLGGLGSRCVGDYQVLVEFVEAPFKYATSRPRQANRATFGLDGTTLERN